MILWFVATERPQRNVGLDVRHESVELQFINLRDDLEMIPGRRSVDISFEGPRLILPFFSNEGTATVDLNELGPGVHFVPVRVELPTGVTLKNVQPREVQVVLEQRVRRTVRVTVSVDGVPPGVIVEIGAVVPEEVDIFGPSSAVEQVATLTARIAYGTGQRRAILTAMDRHGVAVEGVYLSSNTVDVELEPRKDEL